MKLLKVCYLLDHFTLSLHKMDIKIIQTRGQINVYLFTENCHVEFEKSDLI